MSEKVIAITATGEPMAVELTRAHGGISARVYCPPDDPFHITMAELHLFSLATEQSFTKSGEYRRNEDTGKSYKTVSNQLYALKRRYELYRGEYPTNQLLWERLKGKGLLERDTLKTIQRTVASGRRHGHS